MLFLKLPESLANAVEFVQSQPEFQEEIFGCGFVVKGTRLIGILEIARLTEERVNYAGREIHRFQRVMVQHFVAGRQSCTYLCQRLLGAGAQQCSAQVFYGLEVFGGRHNQRDQAGSDTATNGFAR